MKCPVCGDETRDGRCVFCGYRITESDREAAARYEKQKAELTGGPPDLARDPLSGLRSWRPPKRKKPEREPPRQERTLPGRASKPPASRSEQPAAKPARSERTREGPVTKPARKCGPEKHAPPKRPHPAKRFLFKLIVFLWAALYLTLILYKLVDDHGNKMAASGRVPPAARAGISDIADMPGLIEEGPEEGVLSQYDK